MGGQSRSEIDGRAFVAGSADDSQCEEVDSALDNVMAKGASDYSLAAAIIIKGTNAL